MNGEVGLREKRKSNQDLPHLITSLSHSALKSPPSWFCHTYPWIKSYPIYPVKFSLNAAPIIHIGFALKEVNQNSFSPGLHSEFFTGLYLKIQLASHTCLLWTAACIQTPLFTCFHLYLFFFSTVFSQSETLWNNFLAAVNIPSLSLSFCIISPLPRWVKNFRVFLKICSLSSTSNTAHRGPALRVPSPRPSYLGWIPNPSLSSLIHCSLGHSPIFPTD